MRVLEPRKPSKEWEITCPYCEAKLAFEERDIHKCYNAIEVFGGVITCPECKEEINVASPASLKENEREWELCSPERANLLRDCAFWKRTGKTIRDYKQQRGIL